MKVEVVKTVAEWRDLGQEWDVLLGQSSADTVFLSFDWLSTWLEVRDVEPPLFVLLVRDDGGELVGAAPFYVAPYRLCRALPFRVLRMIADCDTGAEYQTWIARSGMEQAVFGRMIEFLNSQRRSWDLIWMPRIDGWTGSHERLVSALRAAGIGVNLRTTDFASVELPDTFDEYLGRMSSNRRQQVRRMSRKILGNPDVTVRKVESQEQLPDALESLFELHTKRWKTVGQPGVFERNPREKLFYEKFVPHALGKGWLAMYELLDGDDVKAVQIGYVYNGVLLQLQEGFDTDYSPHVGNVLRARVFEECIDQGLKEYDFLGGASEHKRRWLADERQGYDMLAARKSLRTWPIVRGGVWPTGRYLKADVGRAGR